MGAKADKASKQPLTKSDESRVERKSTITEELDTFTKAADSLVSAGPLALWSLDAARRAAQKEYATFGQTKCVNMREEDGKQVADVPPDLVPEYRVICRRLERSAIA